MKTRGTTSSWFRASVLVLLLAGGLLPPLPNGIDVTMLAAGMAGLLLMLALLRSPRSVGPVGTFVVPVFIVLFLPVLAAGIPAGGYGREKVLGLIATGLSAAAACLLCGRRDLEVFARVWVVMSLLLAVASLTGLETAAGRAMGFGSNPVWLARALTLGMIAAIWLAMQRRGRTVSTLALLAVMGAALISTGSRGPTLGLIVALLFFGLRALPRITMGMAAVAHFAAAAGVTWLALAPRDGSLGRFFDLVSSPGDALESSRRTDLWGDTLPVIADHPLGVGYGRWSQHVGAGPLTRYPHNLFLELFAEGGWFVGAALLSVTVAVLYRLLRQSRTGDPSAVLVFAMLLAETLAVNVSGDLNARTFFLLLTLGYVVTRQTRSSPFLRSISLSALTSSSSSSRVAPVVSARRTKFEGGDSSGPVPPLNMLPR